LLGLVLGGAATYLGTSAVPPDREFADSAKAGLENMFAARHRLSVATWNIAAINNNPFEYWITYAANPAYEELMKGVEKFLEDPGDKDVKVSSVFTEEMFTQLDTRLTGVGWKSVRSYWESDFQSRNIISGFMKVRYRDNLRIIWFLV
jgi:ABC-type glycerol-3-phosphate transport system substrate-binding protein